MGVIGVGLIGVGLIGVSLIGGFVGLIGVGLIRVGLIGGLCPDRAAPGRQCAFCFFWGGFSLICMNVCALRR